MSYRSAIAWLNYYGWKPMKGASRREIIQWVYRAKYYGWCMIPSVIASTP